MIRTLLIVAVGWLDISLVVALGWSALRFPDFQQEPTERRPPANPGQ